MFGVDARRPEVRFRDPRGITIVDQIISYLSFGSRRGEVSGHISLFTLCEFDYDQQLFMFKSFKEMGKLLWCFSPFDFVKATPYLFPSIPMDEFRWQQFVRRTSPHLSLALFEILKKMDEVVPDTPPEVLLLEGAINNLELNRYVLATCGADGSPELFSNLNDVKVWKSMIRCPEYNIAKLCSFCSHINGKISNEVEPIDGLLVTCNDLTGPFIRGKPVVPSLPNLFSHPDRALVSIWNVSTDGLGGERVVGEHYLDGVGKYHFYKYVVNALKEDGCSHLVYYHFTEGENSQNRDAGWHCHVSAASRGMIKMRCGKKLLDIRWCDYVILCGTFKWLLKIISAVNRESVPITKFCELPFPVQEVYFDLADMNNQFIGRACICLQMFILRTGLLPTDLAVYNSRCKKKDGGVNKHFRKQLLWTELYKFLKRWDFEKSLDGINAGLGRVPIHPAWLIVGKVDGNEFPEWVAGTVTQKL
jgi:hypothetical protein